MIESLDKNKATTLYNDAQQSKDAGMALILIILLFSYFLDNSIILILAIVLLLINMITPKVFLPFSKLWFGLSFLLGTIVSRIILTTSYYCLVTPMGIIRRILGKDRLQLNSWKKNDKSVFAVRNYQYRKIDISKPY